MFPLPFQSLRCHPSCPAVVCNYTCCCCLPTPMTLASGGESDLPTCGPTASFSIHLTSSVSCFGREENNPLRNPDESLAPAFPSPLSFMCADEVSLVFPPLEMVLCFPSPLLYPFKCPIYVVTLHWNVYGCV